MNPEYWTMAIEVNGYPFTSGMVVWPTTKGQMDALGYLQNGLALALAPELRPTWVELRDPWQIEGWVEINGEVACFRWFPEGPNREVELGRARLGLAKLVVKTVEPMVERLTDAGPNADIFTHQPAPKSRPLNLGPILHVSASSAPSVPLTP